MCCELLLLNWPGMPASPIRTLRDVWSWGPPLDLALLWLGQPYALSDLQRRCLGCGGGSQELCPLREAPVGPRLLSQCATLESG